MPLFGQWWFGWSPWQLNLNPKKNIRYPTQEPDSIGAGIRQTFLSTMAFNVSGGWWGNNGVRRLSLKSLLLNRISPLFTAEGIILTWIGHLQVSPQAICTGIWWGEVICRWFIAVPKEVFISGSSRSTQSQTLCGVTLMIETSGLAFYNKIAWKTQKKQLSKGFLTGYAIWLLSSPSRYILSLLTLTLLKVTFRQYVGSWCFMYKRSRILFES